MQRREILKGMTGVLGLSAVSMLPSVSFANEQQHGNLTVQSEITRNHGHALEMSLEDLIVLLRQLNDENTSEVAVDIQGDSGHPHTIFMTQELVMQVLLGDTVEVESSVDAGHAHFVTIVLS